MIDENRIRESLLDFGKKVSTEALFPTLLPDVPEAAALIANDPYAFAIGVCLDRGTKAELIWTIPYYIKSDLGHLDPQRIYKMSADDLTGLFARLPRRPRYVNDAPRTLEDLTRIVVEECDGHAARIWDGKRAVEVNRTFTSIYGVGPGIANMGVLLIEQAFGVRFNDLDHTQMDIKPDVHTVRVLRRLGVSAAENSEAAIEATRRINPSFPGELDSALWTIGRGWCFASGPDCAGCPMSSVCAKAIS